jgi:autophagy-related protein 9
MIFCQSLYNYYYQRGITPILGKGIADLVSLFVTLGLSVLLFAFVDWQELTKCTDEQSCKGKFRDYIIERVSHVFL